MATAGPRRINICPWGYWDHAVAGGTIAPQITTSGLGGAYVTQGTQAQNDEIGWNVVLAASTWTITTIYRTNSDAGIATVKLDSTTLGTFDEYGFGVHNNISTISSVAVAANGVYTLKYVMATKNASSSGYYYQIQWIALHRTA